MYCYPLFPLTKPAAEVTSHGSERVKPIFQPKKRREDGDAGEWPFTRIMWKHHHEYTK